jgi:hypothetical protein
VRLKIAEIIEWAEKHSPVGERQPVMLNMPLKCLINKSAKTRFNVTLHFLIDHVPNSSGTVTFLSPILKARLNSHRNILIECLLFSAA